MVRERKSRPSFQTEGLDYHPEDGKQEWMVEIVGEFQNSGKCNPSEQNRNGAALANKKWWQGGGVL